MDEQLTFANRQEFREWLQENGTTSKGIWLIFGKSKDVITIKADEALEEALCFGWIDGQMKSIDDMKYLKKFTPRRKDSKWSEKNKALVSKLVEQGRVSEEGLAAIELAKRNGNWDAPKAEPVSEDQVKILVNALSGFEPALTNFLKMAPSVRRTYAIHYISAKGEDTKKRRLEQIVGRLNENKKLM